MMSKTSLTVGVPSTLNSLEPIEIKDEQASLHAAYVERYAVPYLPAEWDKNVEGFYILLSHINADNTFTAYVGKTDWSFARRLRSHLESKDYWSTAILFKKNSLEGFNRNQTAYMEGELVKALTASPNVTVKNDKLTGDRNFSEWDKPYMETVLLACLRVLFLRGYRNAHMGAITQSLEERPLPPKTSVAPPPVITAPPAIGTTNNPPVAPEVEPQAVEPARRFFNLLPAKQNKPASEHKPQYTPEQKFNGLKTIVREIRDKEPTSTSSYKYWASNENLRTIIDANPQTLNDLKQIKLNAKWQIKPYLLRSEQILNLFR